VTWPLRSRRSPALLLVRPFTASRRLLRPRLTSRSTGRPASPSQARGEISPGKNTDLPRTTAGFTPRPLGHEGFAIMCPLASVGSASYPVLVHRPAGSFHASFRRSVTLPPLRFPSLAVTCLGEDFHLQVSAHAGRTHNKRRTLTGPPSVWQVPASTGLVPAWEIRSSDSCS